MKYKRICGLIFALLFSVSLFGIDFEHIRSEPRHQDSLGLDTSAYVATLERMYVNEQQNKQHYLDFAKVDSVRSARGVAECQRQMDAIERESMYFAGIQDTAFVDSVATEASDDSNAGVLNMLIAFLLGMGADRGVAKLQNLQKDDSDE